MSKRIEKLLSMSESERIQFRLGEATERAAATMSDQDRIDTFNCLIDEVMEEYAAGLLEPAGDDEYESARQEAFRRFNKLGWNALPSRGQTDLLTGEIV